MERTSRGPPCRRDGLSRSSIHLGESTVRASVRPNLPLPLTLLRIPFSFNVCVHCTSPSLNCYFLHLSLYSPLPLPPYAPPSPLPLPICCLSHSLPHSYLPHTTPDAFPEPLLLPLTAPPSPLLRPHPLLNVERSTHVRGLALSHLSARSRARCSSLSSDSSRRNCGGTHWRSLANAFIKRRLSYRQGEGQEQQVLCTVFICIYIHTYMYTHACVCVCVYVCVLVRVCVQAHA